MSVLLETSLGDMVVDLYHEEVPLACENFLKLCKLKRYNDGHFFSVEKGFVARACDGTIPAGRGASIHSLTARRPPSARETHHAVTHAPRGTISFTGDGLCSEFFVTLSPDQRHLDRLHTPFGVVTEGNSLLDSLSSLDVRGDHRPYRSIRIRHTIILHDPFGDPVGLPLPPASPPPLQSPPAGFLASDDEGGGADDEADARERADALRAKASARVLEIIGDLPDADVAPPDNVLFVCRLNPVTQADDLEIIFSRFGRCKADVVCDARSGKSLNYAFVEFETAKECEKAYFKMDKALVDDRRIRVDFSQSVSGLWNENRRRTRADNRRGR